MSPPAPRKTGGRYSIREVDVTWVLPGATLTQVRDLADPQRPDRATGGQLVAIMTRDNRLMAQIVDPRSNRSGPALSASVEPDDRGLLLRGRIKRVDIRNAAAWAGAWAIMLVTVLIRSRGDIPVLLGGLAIVAGLGALTPNVWRRASRKQREETEKLRAALLARFAVDD
ncbi:MAG: hypothetical protein R2761_28845 [Acidimicrobiales bacterium]